MVYHMEGIRILQRKGAGSSRNNEPVPSVNVQKFHCYGCSLQFQDLNEFKIHKCKQLRTIQNVPMEIEREDEGQEDEEEEEEEASLTDIEMDMKPGEEELQEDPLTIPSTSIPISIPTSKTTIITTTTSTPAISTSTGTGTGILTDNMTNNPIIYSNRSIAKHFVIARPDPQSAAAVMTATLMENLNKPPLQQQQQSNQRLQTEPKLYPTISIVNSYSLNPGLRHGDVDKVNVQCKGCSTDFLSLKLFIKHINSPPSTACVLGHKRIKTKLSTKQTQTPREFLNNNNNSNSNNTPSTPSSSLRSTSIPTSTSTSTYTPTVKNVPSKNNTEVESSQDKNEQPKLPLPFVNVRCFGCDGNFKSTEAMRLHLSPANRVKCPRCPDLFDLYCSLRKHIEQHSKEDAALKANTSQPPSKTYGRKVPAPVALVQKLKPKEKVNNNNNNNNNNSFESPPSSPLASFEPEEEEKVDESAFRFPCPREGCSRRFETQRMLNLHIQSHEKLGKSLFKCPHCPRLFRKRNILAAHKLADHGDGLKCTEDPLNCSHVFTLQNALNVHIKKYHSPGNPIIPPPQIPVNSVPLVGFGPGGPFRTRGRRKNGRWLRKTKPNKTNEKIGRPGKIEEENSTIESPVEIEDVVKTWDSENELAELPEDPNVDAELPDTNANTSMNSEEKEKEEVNYPFKCTQCSGGFLRQDQFEKHVRLHRMKEEAARLKKLRVEGGAVRVPPRNLVCPQCPAPIYFPNNSFLIYHLKKAHNISEPELSAVRINNIKKKSNYKQVWNYCYHKDCVDVRPYVRFDSRTKLIKHKLEEHGEEDTRPVLKCPQCPAISRGPKALQIHIEQVHEKKRDFLCDICGMGFYSADYLRRHEKVHSDIKSYKCDVENCGKLFKTRTTLTHHKKIHLGEKKYLCSFCARAFMTLDAHNVHLRLHSEDRRFKCPVCPDVGYNHKVTLKGHMQKIHPDWEGQL